MMVDIVLAAYNGARFLEAQIESILAQDYKDWRLIIRDDASTDATADLITAYEQKYPERIQVVRGERKRLGIIGNFSNLLSATTAPYVMLADQDDVWLPHKISLTLSGMKELEKQHGGNAPLLIHTDSAIVTETLQPVADSFNAHHKLNAHVSPFARLLVQNTAQGCTMMLNRALLALALPLPAVARMHDMWLAQVAAGLGHIGYVDQQTVKYRQHGSNAVGARSRTLREKVGHIQNMMEGNVTQAIMLRDRFEGRLSELDKKALQQFAKLLEFGFFKRRFILLRHNILRQPGWENVPMLVFL